MKTRRLGVKLSPFRVKNVKFGVNIRAFGAKTGPGRIVHRIRRETGLVRRETGVVWRE
ncbi:hypothetical protein [Bacillus marinisedimentorum]|uniref:hypothetical protein n=1 Tax=Bacillus marinisedimentorum TaxID=1821260 RepID=UPI00147106BF|nr:hypothetical protein [Bacillus marinisedimentorum]